MGKLSEDELRQVPLTALFAALAIVLPQFFHMLGLGIAFLPMYLPVMAGSMLLSWRFALSVAIISPLVSWLLTSMPPLIPPVLPVLMVELIAVSLVISILRFHLGKPVWLALFTAIIIDRVILFLIVSIVAPLLGFTHPFFSLALVITGIPGIILQIITIPLALHFIDRKFPQYYMGQTVTKQRHSKKPD